MYKNAKCQKTKSLYKSTFGVDAISGDGEYETGENKQLRLLQSCLRITYTSPKTMHWIERFISVVNENKGGKDIIELLEQAILLQKDS